MVSSSQSSVSDDDDELGALIYNSSRPAQRIRAAAAPVAEEEMASFGVVAGVQTHHLSPRLEKKTPIRKLTLEVEELPHCTA